MKLVHLIAVILLISIVSGAKLRKRPVTPAQNHRRFQHWDPNQLCYDDLNLWRFADTECDQYWECQDDGSALLAQCDFGLIYDLEWEDCFSREVDGAVCWSDGENDECPLYSNDVITFPGYSCEDYYMCINGQPIQMWCRPGQHWNVARKYCDNPRAAGCDPTANDVPELPDYLGNQQQTRG